MANIFKRFILSDRDSVVSGITQFVRERFTLRPSPMRIFVEF
jgi:hypothetical protein